MKEINHKLFCIFSLQMDNDTLEIPDEEINKNDIEAGYMQYQNLICQNTAKLLEAEFYNKLLQLKGVPKLTAKSIQSLNLRQEIQQILLFIEQNYLYENVNGKIHYKTDSLNTPIWGILYVMFRAGMHTQIEIVLNKYQGGEQEYNEIKKFQTLFNQYIEYNGDLPKQQIEEAKQFFLESNENTDQFQFSLYCLLLKHPQINKKLTKQIIECIWMNLKICQFEEESSKKQNDMFMEDSKSLNDNVWTLDNFQEDLINYYKKYSRNESQLSIIYNFFLIQCYQQVQFFFMHKILFLLGFIQVKRHWL
eukprot:TRINITY_DN13633_c0_g1_i2.p1 TRINITY_DN13633_c0_g1~~TRINITY_DN13633_c0_g1_i2.p1  ORF type:complete len:306 (+),score=48.95 TRINITY_DN13633_c0_g1_i2:470-1387(+)